MAIVNIALNVTANQVKAAQELYNAAPDKADFANVLLFTQAKYLDDKLVEGLNRMEADARRLVQGRITMADILALSAAEKDQICAILGKPAGFLGS